MGLIWDLYWPVGVLALLVGAGAGLVFLRPDRRGGAVRWVAAVAFVGAATFGWHLAIAAPTLAEGIEGRARQALVDLEMERVSARLEREPLSRTLLLSGPADDFQRSELARRLSAQPGVREARWEGAPSASTVRLPLAVEAELLALIGFCLGLMLAYVYELRRRARLEWGW